MVQAVFRDDPDVGEPRSQSWWERYRAETLVLGAFVSLLGALILPQFVPKQAGHSPVPRIKNDQRSMATALETYFIENNAYPALVPMKHFVKNAMSLARAHGERITAANPGLSSLAGLTTPVAYLTSFFADPFAPEKGMPFGYYADANGFIMFSPGRDGIYDLDPPADYTSSIPQPSLTLVVTKTYDSTNGTESAGDIYRVKQ